MLLDSFNRKIDYLRMSVTDRCNLRCVYCMPAEGVAPILHEDVLRYEEIIRVAGIFAGLGIKKIRITGGEPLVRKGIVGFIQDLRKINGIDELALTTNGILLGEYAKSLHSAGISRINISLDTLDPSKYNMLTRGGKLDNVINSILTAQKEGFKKIRINAVLSDYFEKKDAYELIAFSRDNGMAVRFIEMMPMPAAGKEMINNPLNLSNIECSVAFAPDNKKDPVSSERLNSTDIIKIMKDIGNYNRDKSAKDSWGPSEYFIDESKKSRIGLIINSNKACFFCNRLRLSPEGNLRLCLFSDMEMDLKALLRPAITNDDIIKNVLIDFIKTKPENRQSGCISHDFKLSGFMNRIGG